MAEILGIAAAAAQFLTIAVKLSVKLNWICSEVHHAPKRLQDLRKSLDQQITLIKNIAETDFYGSAIVAAKKADFIHVLGEYQDIIQRLLDLLQRLLDQDDKGIIRKGWNSILTLHKTDEILLLCSRIEEKRDLVLLWLSDINLYARKLPTSYIVYLMQLKRAINEVSYRHRESIKSLLTSTVHHRRDSDTDRSDAPPS